MLDLTELYGFKAKYEHEALVAQAKVAVVNDMIATEEEKLNASEPEVEEVITAEETV